MRAITREPGERGSGRLEICERDHDGVRVIGVVGDLDLGAAAEFCARVDAARAGGSTRLLLDLTQLGFCDSSGLRALIGAAEFCLCTRASPKHSGTWVTWPTGRAAPLVRSADAGRRSRPVEISAFDAGGRMWRADGL
jgi:hypothetical protein